LEISEVIVPGKKMRRILLSRRMRSAIITNWKNSINFRLQRRKPLALMSAGILDGAAKNLHSE
jgi:hypothetical protein